MTDIAEYTGAIYRSGQEFAVSMASEAGMLGPSITAIPALASDLALVGYTDVPGITKPEGTAAIYAVGDHEAVRFLLGRREPVIDMNLTLGTAQAAIAILSASLRKSGVVANTHQCLPVFALLVSATSTCQSGRDYKAVGRFCLINSLTINAQEGAPVTASLNIWPLYIDEETALAPPSLAESALFVAGGEAVFGWQHLKLAFGGQPETTEGEGEEEVVTPASAYRKDYTDLVQSVSINVSNNLRRSLMRPASHGTYLGRAARQIQVGMQVTTITLGLADKLPEDVLYDLGVLEMVLSDGFKQVTITTQANFVQTSGQNASTPDAPVTYNATILAKSMSIAWEDIEEVEEA